LTKRNRRAKNESYPRQISELQGKAVKIEQIEQDVPAEEEKEQQPAEPEFEEEADLLESALDAIQDAALQQKTREEAEADRMKLLAGEPLEEGDYAVHCR
jgi:hypothetical protein